VWPFFTFPTQFGWNHFVDWTFFNSAISKKVGTMQQHSSGRELGPTAIATTDRTRQGMGGDGMRYVLSFGLLGVIFVFSMMLVIFVS
jgi:hypothetical protein